VRGLTAQERNAILAKQGENIDGNCWQQMVRDGRLAVIGHREDGDEMLRETDLGLLALRVCPPEDA